MKLYKYTFIILLLVLTSCDFLNYNEEDFISDEEFFFEEFDRTKAALTNLYSNLPNGFNEVGGSMRSSASDDAVEADPQSSVHDFYNGSWSPINTIDSRWGVLYGAIRDANLFIQRVDTTIIEDRKYNENYDLLKDQIQYFKPEARFLRAYYYFELLRRYGGVPLVTETLNANEANTVELNSANEIVEFIVDECDAILNDLPVSFTSVMGMETGRATKGAVMALKTRTLLYAASPQLNPSNDQGKWETVAEASAAIIDSSWYSLENSYSNAVNKFPSDELIFGRRLNPSNLFERNNFPVGYQGEPGTCPTQNLVNTYEMLNGMDINEVGSGYDPDNPYENRDPRLKKTVIVNNSEWKGRKVEIWRGGLDGPPQELSTPTGYYLKKYVIEDLQINDPNPTTQEHLWTYFRYAEVLLNYAEAMNEAYGPTNDPQGYGMTAMDAVNMVRDRAGMPGFSSSMGKDQFRNELQEERRIELSFENHRFWDIRRWKIGPSTQEIKGMNIERMGPDSFSYKKEVIENRIWQEKMSFYPFPQNEIFINGNIQQNPGW